MARLNDIYSLCNGSSIGLLYLHIRVMVSPTAFGYESVYYANNKTSNFCTSCSDRNSVSTLVKKVEEIQELTKAVVELAKGAKVCMVCVRVYHG